MDFGRLGLIHDPETGRRRTVWGLLLVLGHSRHSFLWPTFGQTLEDVIAGLESAWAFFGGIPKYLVIDIAPRRWRWRTPCIPSSPGASWSTPSTALHRRLGPRPPSQGQAQGGAGRPLRQGAFLQGRRVQRSG